MWAVQFWSETNETERKADGILHLLLERANPVGTDGPVKSAAVLAVLKGKILAAVERGEPVPLVLPAFPAKSPNPEKTLGHLPDYGEVLALTALNSLCAAIGEIHGPGAKLILCSDGRVFSDLVRVSDEQVNEYGVGIRRILERGTLAHLETFSLDDVCTGFEFDRMRRSLVESFGTSLDEIRTRTKEESEHRNLFNGIHRFIFEDRVVLEPHKSRSRVREESKDVAYEVIQRSNAWGALVQEKFPEAVRLSIHPQGAESEKLGIKLLPSRNAWRTPWHGVVVNSGHGFELSTRRAAEEAGAVLAQSPDGYGYFKALGSW